ncbi:hypothetical protein AJ87_45540 [Rhizobium yanglingense]|nr:hypothetical protein AJ87_45540 [Rhizobium yanglingense]
MDTQCQWIEIDAGLSMVQIRKSLTNDRFGDDEIAFDDDLHSGAACIRSRSELERCANELSCRLITWGYGCGYGELYDAMSVFVERPKGRNTEVSRETFVGRSCLGGVMLHNHAVARRKLA